MRGELPCRARSARRNTRPRPGLLRTHGTPSLCRYLTRPRTPPAAATVPGCCERAVCRNRRKSKWRNRRGRPRHPGAARRYRLLLLAAAVCGVGPVHGADPGMWKWLTARNSTARFRFCSILGRLCEPAAPSSGWQQNGSVTYRRAITQSLIQLLYWYTQLHKLQKLSQSLMRTPPPTTPPQRYKLLPVVLFNSTLFDYLLLRMWRKTF